MSDIRAIDLPLVADDGHAFRLIGRLPASPRRRLLWLPALGVAARHYLPFADALAALDVAVFIHEWRGHGSSGLRAGRAVNWGYRELLTFDLPASEAAIATTAPGMPILMGGHSLGGQLACCRLAIAPQSAEALWLVASGAPYWRAFPLRQRWCLPLVYRFLPWLSDLNGALPGRRIGFGGSEARGVIRDWSRTALSGRYAASGLDCDLESTLRDVTAPVRCIVLRDDWLAPRTSLRFLLSKLSPDSFESTVLDADALGVQADHFTWMRAPAMIAETLSASAATKAWE